jgi:hypothetical protein
MGGNWAPAAHHRAQWAPDWAGLGTGVGAMGGIELKSFSRGRLVTAALSPRGPAGCDASPAGPMLMLARYVLIRVDRTPARKVSGDR